MRRDRYLAALLIPALTLAACSKGSNTSPPVQMLPSLRVADATLAEGDSGTAAMSFSVSLSSSSTTAVSVQYETADGTATAGSDYTATSGTLTIAAGSTGATISVDVLGDTLAEGDETFTLLLRNASGATIAAAAATGTIGNDDAMPLFGLDDRPDNQTCVAPARPGAVTAVAVENAFPSLSFFTPIKLLMEPVADPRWFIMQRNGQILVVDPDNPTTATPYLDISNRVVTTGEGGLLGFAFHPDYPATPELFLYYTGPSGTGALSSIVSRFIFDDVIAGIQNGSAVEEQTIITVDQFASNHNGGDIAFGPDGYLYWGLGDGGSGDDPNDTGQDTTNLLGSFLRIDVNGPTVSYPSNRYAIPAGADGNPFQGQSKCGPTLSNSNNCPEIYAWGFRNPFRWSFDTATGNLWAGDVGQGLREEVDIVVRGNNYGWDCREGAISHPTASNCAGPFTEPVYDYERTDGNSITGGMVYRGSAIDGRVGQYIYSDYGSGRIWALREDGQGGYVNEQLLDEAGGPVAFAADQDGELYYANIQTGSIYKLVPGGVGGGSDIPALLSDTGCVDPSDVTQPYAGLLPYDINAPFWSDGADKTRFIGLPNGTAISIDADDDWVFPPGTVIVKNFSLNGSLVETRHLMRHPDGVWAGYTYEWRSTQDEADLVIGGKTVTVNGQDWIFPSSAQCEQCHTMAAGFALGPETAQLNRDFTYPATGRTDNQLRTIDHVMMFASPLAGSPDVLPRLAEPSDVTADLDDRARAYLHTNCANCHRPGGPTPVDIDLRHDTALQDTGTCDVAPTAGALGIVNARIIAPGDAARSTLVARANRRDADGMPPLGSNIVDAAGVALLTEWVDGLTGCQ